MPNNINIEIGKRIRAEREKMGLTRDECSERINLSSSFLYDLENGKSGPSTESLIALSQLFGISTDYLLGISPVDDYTHITRYLQGLSSAKLDAVERIIKEITNALQCE